MTDDEEPLETIAGGAGVIFGGRFVKIALLFLIEVLMARILGSTAYGTVVIATLTMSLAVWVGRLGIPRGLIRNLPYYEDDPAKARGVLRAGATFAALGGTVTGAAVFLLAPFLARRVFHDPDLVLLLRIAAAGVPLGVLTGVGLATARAGRTARPRVIVNHFLNPIGQALFVGGLVLAGYGALGAVVGRVLTRGLVVLVALYLGYRALRFPFRGRAKPMRREMLAFSIPLMFAAGVDFVISNTDTFLIGTFLASSAVGFYNAAFKLRTAGLFFFFPITYLLPPVITRLDAGDDLERARRVYQVVTKWGVLLTTPVFLAVFFFPRTVIHLSFGSQYLAGATPLRILAVPVMVTVLMGANEKALIALGHNRISLYVNLAVAAINVALNVAFIPRIGIVGAAVASAVAFVVRDVAFTVALYRWEGLHPISGAAVRPFVAAVVVALAGYPLVARTVGINAPSVIAAGLVFLAVYVPVSVRLGALESEDARVLELVEDRLGREVPYLRRVASVLGNANR